MGFWNVVGKVASAAMEQGAKKQAEIQKKAGRKLQDYEKKLDQAEGSGRMSNPAYAQKVEQAREKLNQAKVNVYTGGAASDSVTTSSTGQVLIGGKTTGQWESQWHRLGTLRSLTLGDLSPYNHSIGLYKAEMGGEIYYIGRAIEYSNGGFRKRLRDYVRDSDSARTHGSGGKMNENADRVQISLLVVGNSAADVDTVKALEKALIQKYTPAWNVQFNRV